MQLVKLTTGLIQTRRDSNAEATKHLAALIGELCSDAPATLILDKNDDGEDRDSAVTEFISAWSAAKSQGMTDLPLPSTLQVPILSAMQAYERTSSHLHRAFVSVLILSSTAHEGGRLIDLLVDVLALLHARACSVFQQLSADKSSTNIEFYEHGIENSYDPARFLSAHYFNPNGRPVRNLELNSKLDSIPDDPSERTK